MNPRRTLVICVLMAFCLLACGRKSTTPATPTPSPTRSALQILSDKLVPASYQEITRSSEVISYRVWRECWGCSAQRLLVLLKEPQKIAIQARSQTGVFYGYGWPEETYRPGDTYSKTLEWKCRVAVEAIEVDAIGDEPINWLVTSETGEVLLKIENSSTQNNQHSPSL